MRHSISDEMGKTVRVAAHGQWAKGLTLVSIRDSEGDGFFGFTVHGVEFC